MATVPTITTIQKTECIGNSLITLTNNFDNIRNAFSDFNQDLTVLNNTLNSVTTLVNTLSSAQLAKAWVKFAPRRNTADQQNFSTSNRLIYSSYNVTSVYRESQGVYTVNLAFQLSEHFVVSGFTSPNPSVNFSGLDSGVINLQHPDAFPVVGQSCRIRVNDLRGNLIDPTLIMLTFFDN